MANRIQLRRDTATNWYNVNPLLSQGEPGLETDTTKLKYGDGSTYWRDLPYASLGSAYDQNLNTTDTPTFAGINVTDNIASTSGSLSFSSTDNQFYFVQGEGAGVEVHASTLVSNEIYPATGNTFDINGDLRVGGQNVGHGATGTVFLRQLSLTDADSIDPTPFTITFTSEDNPSGILNFSNSGVDIADVSTTTWTFNQTVDIGGSTLRTANQDGRDVLELTSPSNRFVFNYNGGEGTIVEISNVLEVVNINPWGNGGSSNPDSAIGIGSRYVPFGTIQNDQRLDGTIYVNTIAFDTNPAIGLEGHYISYDPVTEGFSGSLDFYTYNSDLTTFKITSITSGSQVWYKPNGDIIAKINEDGVNTAVIKSTGADFSIHASDDSNLLGASTTFGGHIIIGAIGDTGYTLPLTKGSENQILKLSGSALVWADQSGGSASTGDITFSGSVLTSNTDDPIGLHTQGGTVNIDQWGYPTDAMRLSNAIDGDSIILQANGSGAQAKLRWHQTPDGGYRSIYSEVRTVATGVEIHNADWSDDPTYDYKWSFNTDGSLTYPDNTTQTTSGGTQVYARSALPTGVIGRIITISDSGSDSNSPAGNWAPAYWDDDAETWTYIGNSNSVTAI